MYCSFRSIEFRPTEFFLIAYSNKYDFCTKLCFHKCKKKKINYYLPCFCFTLHMIQSCIPTQVINNDKEIIVTI